MTPRDVIIAVQVAGFCDDEFKTGYFQGFRSHLAIHEYFIFEISFTSWITHHSVMVTITHEHTKIDKIQK